MTSEATELTVRKTVTVEAPVQRAFAVFTEEMASWWPLETHHIGERAPTTAVMEPSAGGRWFERADDGSECEWGRVIAWEPPSRVVLAWHLGPDWKYDPDPGLATEVEVRFVPEGAQRTRVELEHRGFERHGDLAEAMRARIDSPQGWAGLLARYADAVRG